MKGILLKDFYNLNGQLKVYALFPILGLTLAYFQHSLTIMIFMLGILVVTVPMSALAYDDMADFSTYALTMPILRKDLVLSKFILSFLLMLICGIVSFAAVFVLFQLFGIDYFEGATLQDALLYAILYLFAMNAVNCLILPLMFQFGTEKGRIFFFLIFFGIGGLGYAANMLLSSLDPVFVTQLVNFFEQFGLYVVAAGAIALEAGAILVSNRIMKKKEF